MSIDAQASEHLDFLDGLVHTLETTAERFPCPPFGEADQGKLLVEWSRHSQSLLGVILAGGWAEFLVWLEFKHPSVAENFHREVTGLVNQLAALNEGESDYQSHLQVARRMLRLAPWLSLRSAELRRLAATIGATDRQPPRAAGAGNASRQAAEDQSPAWEFVPGGALYRGHTIRTSGKPLAVLRALVEARHQSLTEAALFKQVWPHEPVQGDTVRSAIKNLRSAIRTALADKVELPRDPIPAIERGARLAWQLALE